MPGTLWAPSNSPLCKWGLTIDSQGHFSLPSPHAGHHGSAHILPRVLLADGFESQSLLIAQDLGEAGRVRHPSPEQPPLSTAMGQSISTYTGSPWLGPPDFLIQGGCQPACIRLVMGEAVLQWSFFEGRRPVFPESFAVSLWDEVWGDEEETSFSCSQLESSLVLVWVLTILSDAPSLSP